MTEMDGGRRFAAWSPGSSRRSVAAWVGEAVEADLDEAAELAERLAGRPGGWRERLGQDLADPERFLVVARVPEVVVGYARTWSFEPDGDPPANAAPAGWYLGGLIVEPDWRRCGLGEALTAARLVWLRERTREVWYFANEANRASLKLHADLGFEEVTRDFSFRGETFDGGTGVLCRLCLRAEPPS